MNIHKDRRKQHFTKNIIDYAHDNNFMALAEGVELPEELKTVISMGVDLIQGYYTGRPSAELVPEIKREIFDEIREYNRLFENKRPRKTFFAGAEKEISLMTLDFDSYTEIIVSKSEYVLKGAPNYVSDISIKVKDGIDCRLDLVDLAMKNESAGACIIVGKNSRLVLNICGDVTISGAIEVPEGSSLEIVGTGSLSLTTNSNHSYAIGTSTSRSYGNISVKLENRLKIHLESDMSVAIGGGFNGGKSVIEIEAAELIVEQLGKKSMAVGCVNGCADVSIRNTALTLISHSGETMLLGSMNDDSSIELTDCKVNAVGSGNLVCFAGSRSGGNARFKAENCEIGAMFNGKNVHAVGADKGTADIELINTKLNLRCSGGTAIALGSSSHKGSAKLIGCGGQIYVNSGTYYVYAYDSNSMLIENCSIEKHINE